MKELLLALFSALIALARTPADEEESVACQRKHIQQLKDKVDTIHGDCDLNEPDVVTQIDDLVEMLATSTPHPDYAEVPADPEDTIDGEAERDADADADPAKAEAEAEAEAAEVEDKFTEMDRAELKAAIHKFDSKAKVLKSHTDEQLREEARRLDKASRD